MYRHSLPAWGARRCGLRYKAGRLEAPAGQGEPGEPEPVYRRASTGVKAALLQQATSGVALEEVEAALGAAPRPGAHKRSSSYSGQVSSWQLC